MYEVRINGVPYDTNYEYAITYTMDKSLDFGSIDIPFVNQQNSFPMYSVVEITRDNDEVETFLLSGDVVKISSYNPLLYSHTVQLVEYTKKLDNYIITSCAFTQPTDGSLRYNYYDVLDRLIKISIFETSGRESGALPCVISSDLLSLQNMPAPEFFFYNKTLREALDSVLGTLPAIARLKRINGLDTLTADFLDATKSIVDSNFVGLTYDAEQNVQNYSTSMVSDVTNAIRGRKGLESISVFPNGNGFASLTSREGFGVLDDNNSVMNVKQGIYDIVKLEVQALVDLKINALVGNPEINENRVVTVDLSRFVVTKEQYEALRGSWDDAPVRGQTVPGYQNLPAGITQSEMIEQGILNQQNAIWFEPGSTFIDGLTTDWQSTFLTPETQRRRSLENAILTALDKEAIYNEVPQNQWVNIYRLELGRVESAFGPADVKRFEMCFFRCTFIPQEKYNRIEVERDDLTNFSKEAFSYFKQNTNLINLNAYVNKMNADLQRTGEEAYVVNAVLSSYEDLLTLGDVTQDGDVLISYTLTQFVDYLEVSYNFSKNYQQINEMIAVDKSNDFFELVSGNKVLDRFVVYKDYAIVSTQPLANFTPTASLFNNRSLQSYYNTFDTTATTGNMAESSMLILPGKRVMGTFNGSGSGRNLILTTSFQHNAIAGFQIEQDDETKGFIQIPVFYAEEGELLDFDLIIFDRFTNTPSTFDDEVELARKLPLVDRNDFLPLFSNLGAFLGKFRLYKDPGERLNINYQIQTIVAPTDTEQIIIGNYFSNFNLLVHQPKEQLFIHFSNESYSKGNVEQVKLNTGVAIPALDATMTGNVLTIHNTIPSVASYGVSDSSGRLLFAVNRKNNVLPNTLYFTFSHTRPGLQKL